MRDIPTASFLMWSLMVSHTLTMNWWGTTKIRMSAPFTESAKSGTANWWGERKCGETSTENFSVRRLLVTERCFHAHHIGGQLVTGQVFHVFVVCVDDFCEFTAVHRLFEHPHVHCGVKLVILGCVGTHNLGNGRAPVDMESQMVAVWTCCFPWKVKCLFVCFSSVISKLYMDFN